MLKEEGQIRIRGLLTGVVLELDFNPLPSDPRPGDLGGSVSLPERAAGDENTLIRALTLLFRFGESESDPAAVAVSFRTKLGLPFDLRWGGDGRGLLEWEVESSDAGGERDRSDEEIDLLTGFVGGQGGARRGLESPGVAGVSVGVASTTTQS